MKVAVERRFRLIPRHYGKPKGWRGTVERRDPATYQDRPRDAGIVRCGNQWCRLWIVSGSTRCPHCHERQAKIFLEPSGPSGYIQG